MAKKNNVYQLSAIKESRERKKKAASLSSMTAIEIVQKDYFELAVRTLLNALKCKDAYTWGHSLRVAYFCVSVGRELGLSDAEIYDLEVSALFHDIGKIGVPDSVLLKPSRLTDEEFLEMKLHPSKSFEILEEFPIFHKMAVSAKYHHERFDVTRSSSPWI